MRCMLLLMAGGYGDAAPGIFPDAAAVARMTAYNRQLRQAGVLLGLDGLHPPSMGARVGFAGGHPLVTDGPFAEARDVLGGYWMIDVASMDEAVEWARRCPAGPGDVIEVRRVQEVGEFPEDLRAAAAQGMQAGAVGEAGTSDAGCGPGHA